MSDLISREDAIDYFVTNIGVVDEDGYAVDDYDERVKIWTERFSGIPSAEPERKKGKWIEYPDCLGYEGAYSDDHIVCSECGHVFSICDNCTEEFDFCPHCGSDMRGV